MDVGERNSLEVFAVVEIAGVVQEAVDADLSLHLVLLVLPLPAEDCGQRFGRVHVPRAKNIRLASGCHSESKKV